MIVAFTGIREADPREADEIEMAVLDVIAAGATELRFGGALGADTMALEAAGRQGGIRRVVYVPFTVADQPKEAREVIARSATVVHELRLPHGKRAYLQRNRAMLEGAHRVVAFTDGRQTGGTQHTMNVAREMRIPVTVVPVEKFTKNPAIAGLELSAKLWSLQEYDSRRGVHPLSDIVRANKQGEATAGQIEFIENDLMRLIMKMPDLQRATAICAMPRRVPGPISDMMIVALGLVAQRGLDIRPLLRTIEPSGGEVKARRLRFPADEHARTLIYEGPANETVIVLDNVVTTGASMEGAFRAVRAAGATPLGLSVLYSTAFGAKAV